MQNKNFLTKSRWLVTIILLLSLGITNVLGGTSTLNSWGSNTSGTSYYNGGSFTDNNSGSWSADGYRVSTNLYLGKAGVNYLQTPSYAATITKIVVTCSGSYYLKVVDTNGEEVCSQQAASGSPLTFTISGDYKQLRLFAKRQSSITQNAQTIISSVDIYYLTMVTLDKNGGDADGTIYFDYNATGKYTTSPYNTFSSALTRSGYTCKGYYTASSGGEKVLNADGTFAAASVSESTTNYITSNKWVYAGGTLTLYAQWESASSNTCV